MKTIFYDLNLLESHSNVYIKQHTPTPKNVIYIPDKPYESFMSIYFNIIRNHNGLIQLYYRSAPKNINNMFCKYAPFTQYTAYAESNNGIDFNKPTLKIVKYMNKINNNIILKEGMASTNFFVFYDELVGRYRGIGGGHNDYVSIKSKGNHLEECVKVSKYIDVKMGIFDKPLDSNVEHSCRVNGMYLWDSDDGINWDLVYNKPFINGFHPGGCDRPSNGEMGISPFDGFPSIFYDTRVGEYRLYIRGNPMSNIRNIQYTTSKDFINWKPFQFVTFDPPFNFSQDNYYYTAMQKYPKSNQYFTLLPYYPKNSPYNFSTFLAYSEDGLHWKRLGKVIDKQSFNNVSGLISSNDNTEMYIYLQENYMNKHRKMPRNNVRRYSIRMDGFTSIHADIKGSFTTKKMKLCNFKINYKIWEDGYVIVNILNRHRDIIETFNLQSLDSLDYPVIINEDFHYNNGYLQFNIYKADIFAINLI
jgi:hypothetical protein